MSEKKGSGSGGEGISAEGLDLIGILKEGAEPYEKLSKLVDEARKYLPKVSGEKKRLPTSLTKLFSYLVGIRDLSEEDRINLEKLVRKCLDEDPKEPVLDLRFILGHVKMKRLVENAVADQQEK